MANQIYSGVENQSWHTEIACEPNLESEMQKNRTKLVAHNQKEKKKSPEAEPISVNGNF